jgi:hypothetical protein
MRVINKMFNYLCTRVCVCVCMCAHIHTHTHTHTNTCPLLYCNADDPCCHLTQIDLQGIIKDFQNVLDVFKYLRRGTAQYKEFCFLWLLK